MKPIILMFYVIVSLIIDVSVERKYLNTVYHEMSKIIMIKYRKEILDQYDR